MRRRFFRQPAFHSQRAGCPKARVQTMADLLVEANQLAIDGLCNTTPGGHDLKVDKSCNAKDVIATRTAFKAMQGRRLSPVSLEKEVQRRRKSHRGQG